MGRDAAQKLTLDQSRPRSQPATRERDGSTCFGMGGGHIGRDAEACDLHIDIPYVSRRHAAISYHAGSFFLEDCESVDGTLLNDERLQAQRKVQLLDRDVISIGDQLIEISIPEWTKYVADIDDAEEEDEARSVSADSEDIEQLLNQYKSGDDEPAASTEDTTESHDPPEAQPSAADTQATPKPQVVVRGGDDLLKAFLTGLSLRPEDLQLDADRQEAFFSEMGQALFHAVDGVRKALHTHDTFRDQYRIPGTVWNRSQLNPLYGKKIATADAIKVLLTSRSDAVAGLVGAVQEATGDFFLHGVAVPVAVDEAIKSILSTFDWQRLEKEFEDSPGFAGIGPIKKARFWELYCKEFDRHAKTLNEFDNSFRRAVGLAYSEARKRRLANRSNEEDLDAQ